MKQNIDENLLYNVYNIDFCLMQCGKMGLLLTHLLSAVLHNFCLGPGGSRGGVSGQVNQRRCHSGFRRGCKVQYRLALKTQPKKLKNLNMKKLTWNGFFDFFLFFAIFHCKSHCWLPNLSLNISMHFWNMNHVLKTYFYHYKIERKKFKIKIPKKKFKNYFF